MYSQVNKENLNRRLPNQQVGFPAVQEQSLRGDLGAGGSGAPASKKVRLADGLGGRVDNEAFGSVPGYRPISFPHNTQTQIVAADGRRRHKSCRVVPGNGFLRRKKAFASWPLGHSLNRLPAFAQPGLCSV